MVFWFGPSQSVHINEKKNKRSKIVQFKKNLFKQNFKKILYVAYGILSVESISGWVKNKEQILRDLFNILDDFFCIFSKE